MFNRRIAAYLIDLLIFVAVTYLSLVIGSIPKNIVLQLLLSLVVLFVLLFIVFGIVSVLLKGSIGKKIMDLKVLPKVGLVTPIRLFLRDAVAKYLPFVPLIFGLHRLVIQPIDNRALFIMSAQVSLVLIGLVLIANIVFYVKDRNVMLDTMFDTEIENDIPTALEYSNLNEFIKESKKSR